MQSLGNDFVVIDGVSRGVEMTESLARRLGDRHFGVGCDQILVAEADDEVDFRFRIFNQDGSEVEQCGNGARCFARFLRESGLTDKGEIDVRTINTRMRLDLLDNGDVRVNMGLPVFEPARIPLIAPKQCDRYTLSIDSSEHEISALSMGNPHSVMVVDDVDTWPVVDMGARIESHPDFPNRVNAGFMQVISREHIRLRVFERGVGETLGCGSGACAAVVAGITLGLLDSRVRVSLPGGEAVVEWQGDDTPVFLAGPAHNVFWGKIDI